MALKCEHCPLRHRDLFDGMSKEDVRFMEGFKTGELEVEAGTPILEQGSSTPQLYTVNTGMGLRYMQLEDGNRQVLNFVLPGDLLGLQAGVMGENGHSIVATTRMRLCVFKRADLWTLFRAQPSRAYDLTWLAAIQEHFLGETVATIGQRDAEARVAWALLRTYDRLRALGMADNGHVPFPYRQQDLADALGLSLVHTNKTLKRLRDRQLASWANGTLSILDADELARIGAVDSREPKLRPLL